MNLSDYLSEEQVGHINSYFDKARGRHPAWSVLNAFRQDVDFERSPRDYLANEAINIIGREESGAAWLKDALRRVAQTADFEESAASIAEICCFGAMLEAGFEMQPIPTSKTPTPDFRFKVHGIEGSVEVTTKLEHEEQIERARKISEGETPEGVERHSTETKSLKMDFTVSVLHPFGAPDPEKLGDTAQTNAISRICSIKGKETQYLDDKPSLLWVDFRNLGMWPGGLKEEQSLALISGHRGALCSGAIWYGFYGWKGLHVFDDCVGGTKSITPMAHEGRFSKDAPRVSRYSAVIVCLDKATILLESPHAPNTLSNSERFALTRLPWFKVEYSVAEWTKGDIDRNLELARSMIETLAKDRMNKPF